MWLEILVGIMALIFLYYLYFKANSKYWTKRGVYQIDPTFLLGSMPEIFTVSKAINEVCLEHAKSAKDLPYYGEYLFGTPVLAIKDADLIRQVTVKDFEYFVDRQGESVNKSFYGKTLTDKIWAKQMTSASGEEWKSIRATFTPIFTAGKMKAMMSFIQKTCGQLINFMDKSMENNEDIELKTIFGKYSMDTIAICAFGVDSQSFTNDKSLFVKYAKALFSQDLVAGLKMLIMQFPFGRKLFDMFGISYFKVVETEFFYNVILESLKHRRESKIRRNDMVDLMLDAIKGELKHDEEQEMEQFEKDSKLNHVVKKGDFDELVIVATALVLMVAGYDTVSSTLSYCCYELAKNPEVQDKLRAEIEETTDNYEDEISYAHVQAMTYLDQVINETLRLHNVAGLLTRSVEKDYKIPNSDLVLQKGHDVWINSVAVHKNPDHYETPETFNPEHFTKEAKTKRHQ